MKNLAAVQSVAPQVDCNVAGSLESVSPDLKGVGAL